MPKRQYALKRGEAKRLELSWGGFWKNFTISLDGQPIGTIANKEELRNGKEFTLADGSKLRVQLERNQPAVYRNYRPLPDSPTDPVKKHKSAVSLIFLIAVMTAMVALIYAIPSRNARVSNAGSQTAMTITFALAAIFFFLGFMVRRRSRLALWAAIIIYGLDTLLTILTVLNGTSTFAVSIIIHILFLYQMYKGFEGLDALESETQADSSKIPTTLPPMVDPLPFSPLDNQKKR